MLRLQMMWAQKYFLQSPMPLDASWQRGLNEHTNGLIRQYFTKKTRFDKITQKEVKQVEMLLNTRPRRCLNYKTPAEVFFQKSNSLSNDALHL